MARAVVGMAGHAIPPTELLATACRAHAHITMISDHRLVIKGIQGAVQTTS